MANSTTIYFDEAVLKESINAAMISALSDKAKDQLVKQAIDFLTTKQKSSSYSSYSTNDYTPLEQAMHECVYKMASNMVRERFENDPVITKHIQDIFAEAVKKALSDDVKSRLVSALADKITQSFVASKHV